MNRIVNQVRLVLAVVAASSLAFCAANAQSPEPVLGHQFVGPVQLTPNSAQATSVVYDASNQTVSAGSSSTDLASIYGDECVIIPSGVGGTLSAMKFAVFCSGSSTNPLVSATETIRFYDLANSGAYIGGFQGVLGALAKGFYSVYTVTGLDGFGIVFPSNDILVTQQLSNVVGANRMGTVLCYANSPAVGSTNNYYYFSNASSPAGYYLVSGQTYSNPIYELETAEAAVPTHSKSWGQLKALYH
jgi:hypothetical protein